MYGLFREGESIETKSRLIVVWGQWWEWRVIVSRQGVSFWDDGNVPKLNRGDGSTVFLIY